MKANISLAARTMQMSTSTSSALIRERDQSAKSMLKILWAGSEQQLLTQSKASKPTAAVTNTLHSCDLDYKDGKVMALHCHHKLVKSALDLPLFVEFIQDAFPRTSIKAIRPGCGSIS